MVPKARILRFDTVCLKLRLTAEVFRTSFLKIKEELAQSEALSAESRDGRGAFPMLRRFTVKCAGALGRENAGMSNRKISESLIRRKPKVSSAMTIIGGLGVPKDNHA